MRCARVERSRRLPCRGCLAKTNAAGILTSYPPAIDGHKQPDPRHIEVKGRVKARPRSPSLATKSSTPSTRATSSCWPSCSSAKTTASRPLLHPPPVRPRTGLGRVVDQLQPQGAARTRRRDLTHDRLSHQIPPQAHRGRPAAGCDQRGLRAGEDPSVTGIPSTLHLWWARRPLAAARAVIFAQLVNDPGYQQGGGFKYGKNKKEAAIERKRLFKIIEDLVLVGEHHQRGGAGACPRRDSPLVARGVRTEQGPPAGRRAIQSRQAARLTIPLPVAAPSRWRRSGWGWRLTPAT